MSVFAFVGFRQALVPVQRTSFARRSAALASVSIWRRSYASTETGKKGLRVLFFGHEKIGAECLKLLIKDMKSEEASISSIDVVGVPSKDDKGRPGQVMPVAKKKSGSYKKRGKVNKDDDTTSAEMSVVSIASTNMLRVRFIQAKPGSVPTISYFDESNLQSYDVAVICMDIRWVPMKFVRQLPYGGIKVHPSLLPKHRGITPMQTAILNDDKVTGVSIIECMDYKDNGRILAQIPYELTPTTTYKDLQNVLAHLGSKLLLKSLQNLDFVRERAVVQDERQATVSPLYRTDDYKIIWEKMTADDIYRRYRAFHGIVSIHTIWRRKSKMHVLLINGMYKPNPKLPLLTEQFYRRPPGTIFFMRKVQYFEVPCIDGDRVHITNLRVVGRTSKSALEFVNGYLRMNGALRMLTDPVEGKKPTPPFVYPPGHPKADIKQSEFDDQWGF
ncbi:Methionyl-tRNA formyltransferase [Coemansia sp. RSA 2618]|nr:Methionyl-tRNA formyltransferase [Coemansia sp. RSA 2618]